MPEALRYAFRRIGAEFFLKIRMAVGDRTMKCTLACRKQTINAVREFVKGDVEQVEAIASTIAGARTAKHLVVGEGPSQFTIVALTLVDRYADELCLHKRMTPQQPLRLSMAPAHTSRKICSYKVSLSLDYQPHEHLSLRL
jgi:hypothetical protein